MKTDARLVLKRKQQGSVQRNFTDAREVLKMRRALQKKHLGPMSRAAVMGTIKLRKNNNFQQRQNYGEQRQNYQGRPKLQIRYNNSNYKNNYGNSQGRPKVFRNRAQMEDVSALRSTFRTQIQNRVSVPPNKLVRSSRNGITVTTKNTTFQTNRHVIEGDDELERTTLEDLPDIQQNLPPGLLASKKVAQWVTPSTSARPSVASRLLSNDTMHADAIPSPSGSYESTKLVVSNLMPSVTEEDIAELFGDIGPLVSARLLRPGEALITYASARHAAQAVQGYNNILLDGQPMNCYLLPNQERSTVASRLGDRYLPSTSTAYVPHASPVSLYPSTSSSYQGHHNVRFTVKLP